MAVPEKLRAASGRAAVSGLMVLSIEPGTSAEEGGLRLGDISGGGRRDLAGRSRDTAEFAAGRCGREADAVYRASCGARSGDRATDCRAASVIRVLIFARSETEAAELAELMAEDERIEVVSTDPDVVLAAGFPVARAGAFDAPMVVLGGATLDAEGFSHSVRAYLPPDATASEVLAAVAAVGQGLVVLTQAQAERLLPVRRRRDDLPRLAEPLTPREIEVLRLMGDGLFNKEIADRLAISEHTAKFHVASILGKLQASSRTDAVAQGMRRGLIPI